MKNPENIKVSEVLDQDMFDLSIYHEFDINLFNVERAGLDMSNMLNIEWEIVLNMNMNEFVDKYRESLRLYEELWDAHEANNDELYKSF